MAAGAPVRGSDGGVGASAELWTFLSPSDLPANDKRELIDRLVGAKVTARMLTDAGGSLLAPAVLRDELGVHELGFRLALAECYRAATGREAPAAFSSSAPPSSARARAAPPGRPSARHTPRAHARLDARGAPPHTPTPAPAPAVARVVPRMPSQRRTMSPLRGAPSHVALGAAHAPNCTASGAGVLTAVAGAWTALTVISRDLDNRRLLTGGCVLRAALLGPGSSKTRVRDHADGSYAVAFLPSISGEHALRITLASAHPHGGPPTEEHIGPSPLRILVHPRGARALRYELVVIDDGGGATDPARADADAHAHAADAARGARARAARAEPGGAPQLAPPARVHARAGEPVVLGVDARAGEPAPAGLPLRAVLTPESAEPSPRALRHAGGGWEEDEAFGGWLRASAAERAPRVSVREHARARGGGGWSVFGGGAGGGEAAFAYTLSARVYAAGVHHLSVTLDGMHIHNSPIEIRVRAGPPHARACLLAGRALSAARAGEAAKIRLLARDAWGNACARGGARVELLMAAAHAHADGGASAAAERALVRAAPRAGASRGAADGGFGGGSGGGGARGEDDEGEAPFGPGDGLQPHYQPDTVAAPTDRASPAAASAAGSASGGAAGGTSAIRAPAIVEYEVADDGDGAYTLAYRSARAGVYAARVLVDGEEARAPRALTVHAGPCDPLRSELAAAALANVAAGAVATFAVRARDGCGNACGGEGGGAAGAWAAAEDDADDDDDDVQPPLRWWWGVRAASAPRAPPLAAGECSALGGGVWRAQLALSAAGRYGLDVRLGGPDGPALGACPAPVCVWPGPPHAPACALELPPAGVTAGERARVLVRARDAHGNACTRPPERGGERLFRLRLVRLGGEGGGEDDGPGSSDDSGSDGPDSPPPPLPTRVEAFSFELTHSAAPDGGAAEPAAGGGGGGGAWAGALRSGVHALEFSAPRAGEYGAEIALIEPGDDGRWHERTAPAAAPTAAAPFGSVVAAEPRRPLLGGAPFALTVLAGEAEPRRCRVRAPPSGAVGAELVARLTLRDRAGNRLARGGHHHITAQLVCVEGGAAAEAAAAAAPLARAAALAQCAREPGAAALPGTHGAGGGGWWAARSAPAPTAAVPARVRHLGGGEYQLIATPLASGAHELRAALVRMEAVAAEGTPGGGGGEAMAAARAAAAQPAHGAPAVPSAAAGARAGRASVPLSPSPARAPGGGARAPSSVGGWGCAGLGGGGGSSVAGSVSSRLSAPTATSVARARERAERAERRERRARSASPPSPAQRRGGAGSAASPPRSALRSPRAGQPPPPPPPPPLRTPSPPRRRVARALGRAPPLILVAAGPLRPSACVLTGEALALGCVAGRPAEAVLIPCDQGGNALGVSAEGARGVRAVLLPPRAPRGAAPSDADAAAAPPEVTVLARAAPPDGGPGCYALQFTPTRAGAHALRVWLGEAELPASPWRVHVAPGLASAHGSRVEPPPAPHGRAHAPDPEVTGRAHAAVAGERASLTLTARDGCGNACAHEGAALAAVEFSLELEAAAEAAAEARGGAGAPPRAEAHAAHLGGSAWALSFCAEAAGTWVARVAVRGAPLRGPAARVRVVPARTWPAACTLQQQAGFPRAVRASELAELTLVARDRFGNARASGGDRVLASVLPEPAVGATVTDRGDGSYAVRFVPASVGEAVLSLSVGGAPAGCSPHLVEVRAGAPDGARSTAAGPGLGAHVRVNELAAFAVCARDGAGNPTHAGGDLVDVRIEGGDARIVELRDQGNGAYVCSYAPFSAGALAVHVQLNGASIQGSPFEVRALHAHEAERLRLEAERQQQRDDDDDDGDGDYTTL